VHLRFGSHYHFESILELSKWQGFFERSNFLLEINPVLELGIAPEEVRLQANNHSSF